MAGAATGHSALALPSLRHSSARVVLPTSPHLLTRRPRCHTTPTPMSRTRPRHVPPRPHPCRGRALAMSHHIHHAVAPRHTLVIPSVAEESKPPANRINPPRQPTRTRAAVAPDTLLKIPYIRAIIPSLHADTTIRRSRTTPSTFTSVPRFAPFQIQISPNTRHSARQMSRTAAASQLRNGANDAD